MQKNNKTEYKKLYNSIIEGILNKKGKEVVEVDLEKIDSTFCNSFIICHGDSSTQVKSISESVEEYVQKNLNINYSHKEGTENLHWVLMDYADIVVHIFQKEYRDYYKLEELWADGKLNKIEDKGNNKTII